MYALVLRVGDYLFLFDYRKLWKSPVVHVRRGVKQAEVWFTDDVTLRRPGGFVVPESNRIVELVAQHQSALLKSWSDLKEDLKGGRLEQIELVE